VVGVKDERLGEVGAAFLVGPNDQRPDDESLLHWCKNEIANYKAPKIIHWVEELPLNAAGKVLKTTLRKQL